MPTAMDTTNSDQPNGTDPDEGYVDQDSAPTIAPGQDRADGLAELKKDGDLEAAKEHEGREEENAAAELLDSVSGANDIDADNGHSAEEDIEDPEAMRSGLAGKPRGGERPGATAP